MDIEFSVPPTPLEAKVIAMRLLAANFERRLTDPELDALGDKYDAAFSEAIETPAQDITDVLTKLDLLADEIREQRRSGDRADEREQALLAAMRRDLVALYAIPQAPQRPT